MRHRFPTPPAVAVAITLLAGCEHSRSELGDFESGSGISEEDAAELQRLGGYDDDLVEAEEPGLFEEDPDDIFEEDEEGLFGEESGRPD